MAITGGNDRDFYLSLTILRPGAHTAFTERELTIGRRPRVPRGPTPMNINIIPTPTRSFPQPRPAFRVVCAWCEQDMPESRTSQPLTGTSHGICPSCALRHFGVRLTEPFAV